MKFFYLAVSFFALFLLDFYLKANISGIGEEGVSINFLALFFILCGLLFLWRVSLSQTITIRHSTLYLLSFFAYFTFRIGVDTGSLDGLKGNTLSTTSGVVLFYIIGALASIILEGHFKNSRTIKKYFFYYTLFFIAYLIVSMLLLASVFFELTAKLRLDILLIDDDKGSYQRPGNFLVISYILLILLYAQFLSLKAIRSNFKVRLASVIAHVLFLTYTLTSLFVAQIIGSNNATVLIAGLGVIVITILMLLCLNSIKVFLSVKPLSFVRLIFGKLSSRLIVLSIFALAIFIFVLWVAANFLRIDLSMTRIGGFGSGEISSITSRLELLNNFLIHFEYSPLWGNMNVDCLTTGCGSYVHSFLLSLLTHTGLIGFILLLVYFILAYRERFRIARRFDKSHITLEFNIYNLFALLFFSAILFISVVGTFFSWAVIWFSMGLFFPGIALKGKND